MQGPQGRPFRALAWVLGASGIYDLVAFGLLVAMPAWLFTLFDHPVPDDPFLFRLSGLPLLLLPLIYLTAAADPAGRPVAVRLSLAARILGSLGIAAMVTWHKPAGAAAYWFFSVGDLVWAAAYVVAGAGRVGGPAAAISD